MAGMLGNGPYIGVLCLVICTQINQMTIFGFQYFENLGTFKCKNFLKLFLMHNVSKYIICIMFFCINFM